MTPQLTDLGFVELQSLDNHFVIELPYASADNFTQQIIYPSSAKAYLQSVVADALLKAQQKFKTQELALKIWDAYRPFHFQEVLWAHCPDERYVMKPVRDNHHLIAGSAHNRGCAVDVTLVHLTTKQELVMPTLFDDFSRKAHRDYQDCSREALQNCKLLEDVMTECGFIGLPTEWWHFTWHAADDFSLYDLPM